MSIFVVVVDSGKRSCYLNGPLDQRSVDFSLDPLLLNSHLCSVKPLIHQCQSREWIKCLWIPRSSAACIRSSYALCMNKRRGWPLTSHPLSTSWVFSAPGISKELCTVWRKRVKKCRHACWQVADTFLNCHHQHVDRWWTVSQPVNLLTSGGQYPIHHRQCVEVIINMQLFACWEPQYISGIFRNGLSGRGRVPTCKHKSWTDSKAPCCQVGDIHRVDSVEDPVTFSYMEDQPTMSIDLAAVTADMCSCGSY